MRFGSTYQVRTSDQRPVAEGGGGDETGSLLSPAASPASGPAVTTQPQLLLPCPPPHSNANTSRVMSGSPPNHNCNLSPAWGGGQWCRGQTEAGGVPILTDKFSYKGVAAVELEK